MAVDTMQVQKEVRTIIALLMKRPITETVAMEVETHEGFEHLEIVDGQWVGFDEDEYMAGEEHGRIEFKLLLSLGNHVQQQHLGMVYPGDTVFVLRGSPDDIQLKRRPDLAFVSRARVKPSKGYIYAAPDLAVEIISPSDTPKEIYKKLSDYFAYGTQQVWLVYPVEQKVIVHEIDGTATTYHVGQSIPGGDLLPGFMLDLSALF
ncbi:MAG: Uma2 family endonuclease [Anaerolineae bacterium]|nr:Uma2 family endonuclease [Anaerolineae bacterium]